MNNDEEIVKRLSFENWIWAVYVIVAGLNIYADELIKKAVREKDEKAEDTARKIFLGITVVTLIIYIYFLLRNYSDLKKHPDDKAYNVRFLGSVLMFFGSLCLLYFIIKTTLVDESEANI